METEKFHTRKEFNMNKEEYEKRIEELERLNERLVSDVRRLTQELSEKNNYILMLDKADFEAKG